MGIKTKIKAIVENWERKDYDSGIPDEAPFQLEQRGLELSYKMICVALMKNPYNLESIGVSRTKSPTYNNIKMVEIYKRKKDNKQLNIFLE